MNTFLTEYRAQLLASIAAAPAAYAVAMQTHGTPEGMADTYCESIRRRGVRIISLKSPVYLSVTKALGIKHTYKAMEQFIANHA